VRTFFVCTRLRLMGVAWGTASKWLELGIVGTYCGCFLDLLSRGTGVSEVFTETARYLGRSFMVKLEKTLQLLAYMSATTGLHK